MYIHIEVPIIHDHGHGHEYFDTSIANYIVIKEINIYTIFFRLGRTFIIFIIEYYKYSRLPFRD